MMRKSMEATKEVLGKENQGKIKKTGKAEEEELGFEKEKRKRKIGDLSWGLTRTLTDLVFLQICLASGLVFSGRYAQGGIREIFEAYEEIDWEKIRRIAGDFKRKGLIDYTRGKLLEPKITRAGLKRAKSLVSFYDQRRTWDKKIYLITYDIPEESRRDRDKLRPFLEKIGCGMMQASVWLTCYNPKRLVKDFVQGNSISGSVIVSDVGKDGSIGEENLRDLVTRVYRLDELNDRYYEFVLMTEEEKIPKSQIGFAYLSILIDDPQLPFELLPDDWWGEKAHLLSKKLTSFNHGRE